VNENLGSGKISSSHHATPGECEGITTRSQMLQVAKSPGRFRMLSECQLCSLPSLISLEVSSLGMARECSAKEINRKDEEKVGNLTVSCMSQYSILFPTKVIYKTL